MLRDSHHGPHYSHHGPHYSHLRDSLSIFSSFAIRLHTSAQDHDVVRPVVGRRGSAGRCGLRKTFSTSRGDTHLIQRGARRAHKRRTVRAREEPATRDELEV